MITIDNLTPKQKALLTVMWEIDSVEKVHEFIQTLPAGDARDAHSLLKIVIWETLESQGELDAYSDQARSVIASVSR